MMSPNQHVTEHVEGPVESGKPVIPDRKDSLPPGTPAPEGGWGWMIILGGILAQMVFALVTRAFGVIYIEFLTQFGQSPSITGGIGAVSIFASGLLGPLASSLSHRYSSRCVTILGTLLVTGGFVATGFAPNIGFCYFAFGVLVGGGLSLLYTASFVITSEYFVKKRGMAMGIMSTGTNLGALLFPPLMVALFDFYGYTGACMILGALCFHCCVAGALYRPIHYHLGMETIIQNEEDSRKLETQITQETIVNAKCTEVQEEDERGKKEEMDSSIVTHSLLPKVDGIIKDADIEIQSNGTLTKKSPGLSDSQFTEAVNTKIDCKLSKQTKPGLFDIELLRDPTFVGLLCMLTAMAFNLALDTGYVPAFAVEHGVDLERAALLISLGGLVTMFANPLIGCLLDLKSVKPYRLRIYIGFNLLVCVGALPQPSVTTYPGIVTLAAIRAFAVGIIMSQRLTITGDVVGQRRTGSAFGMCMLAHAVGSLFGRALGGILKDGLGSYGFNYYVGGTAQLLGISVLVITLIVKNHHSEKRSTARTDVLSKDTKTDQRDPT